MNAAAKVIEQSGIFTGKASAIEWGAPLRTVSILIMLILFSALSMVYLTNENRLYYIELQQLEQQSQAMQLYKGQLLLEKASLTTASRIELAAVKRLHMHNPELRRNLILHSI